MMPPAALSTVYVESDFYLPKMNENVTPLSALEKQLFQD